MMSRIWVVCLIAMLVAGGVFGGDTGDGRVVVGGRVVDAAGESVDGVTILVYTREMTRSAEYPEPEIAGQGKTDATGEFDVSVKAGERTYITVVATKAGYALGWANMVAAEPEEVAIVLGEPGVIEGKIVDEGGRPIKGAEVRGMFRFGERAFGEEGMFDALKMKTDEQGRFRFTHIPRRAIAMFYVTAEGKATRYAGGEGYKVGDTDIVIELPAAGAIEGKVVNGDSGEPVAGAVVLGYLTESDYMKGMTISTSTNKSGTDGTFSLNELLPGTYRVQIYNEPGSEVKGFGEPVRVEVGKGETKQGVVLKLSQGGTIVVTVADEDTGTGIKGAMIDLRDKMTWSSQEGALTDKEGVAEMVVEPGEYVIQGVHKAGYGGLAEQLSVTVDEGGRTETAFALKAEQTIQGRVVDASGRGVPYVELVWRRGYEKPKTDAEGRFTIYNEGDGNTGVLFVRDKANNRVGMADIDASTTKVEVMLEDAMAIEGRVVGFDGEGIAGVGVSLRMGSEYGGRSFLGDCKTDERGEYSFKTLVPKHSYTVQASYEGDYGSARIDVADAFESVVRPADIVLGAEEYAGKVINDKKEPIEGALVEIYAVQKSSESIFKSEITLVGSAYTTETGFAKVMTKALDDVDDYYAIIWAEGYSIGYSPMGQYFEGTFNLIELESNPVRFAGRVVDSNGRAVVDADVIMMAPFYEDVKVYNMMNKWFRCKTDNHGKFVFDNLPNKMTCGVGVRAEGYGREFVGFENEKERFEPGTENVEIVIARECSLEGAVVNGATGEGIDGINVYMGRQTGRISPYVMKSYFGGERKVYVGNTLENDQRLCVTDQDGDFTAKNLPAGVYKIYADEATANEKGLSGKKQYIEIDEGSRGVCSIELDPIREIVVRVTDNSGEPVPSVQIKMVPLEEGRSKPEIELQTDESGVVRYKLAPGRFKLIAAKEDHKIDPAEREIEMSGEEGQGFELKAIHRAGIFGRCVDEEGRGVAGVKIMIAESSEPVAVTGSEGDFSFDPKEYTTEKRYAKRYLFAYDESGGRCGMTDLKKEATIKMQPAVEFSGRVVDGNGNAISGAKCGFKISEGGPFSEEPDFCWMVESDANGRFKLNMPWEQRLLVEVKAEGFGECLKSVFSRTKIRRNYMSGGYLFVSDGTNTVEGGEFVLASRDLSVSGMLVNPEAYPFVGVPLRLTGSGQPEDLYCTTDESGKFEFEGVCKGKVNIEYDENEDGENWELLTSTSAGVEGLRLTEKSRLIRGKLDRSAEPVASAELEIEVIEEGTGRAMLQEVRSVTVSPSNGNFLLAKPDENGIYRAKVGPGVCEIKSDWPKTHYAASDKLEVVVGETYRVQLVRKKKNWMDVTVVDQDGYAMKDVNLYSYMFDFSGLRDATPVNGKLGAYVSVYDKNPDKFLVIGIEPKQKLWGCTAIHSVGGLAGEVDVVMQPECTLQVSGRTESGEKVQLHNAFIKYGWGESKEYESLFDFNYPGKVSMNRGERQKDKTLMIRGLAKLPEGFYYNIRIGAWKYGSVQLIVGSEDLRPGEIVQKEVVVRKK
ncbi:putative lipoprotein, rSAM/lipoprotein system [Anaerohalosphaera lusitana]|uniref:Putative lipoprotein, rSAM/lipoprotein system n=1 Tax=Anaerohalosphaera lusitana TaxID=1936003 RepID=A0A1U9NJF6_9BACT|nr:carboxypeptidase-like regulatory domain-containing protein [Anaerohalosphaera lusitana]AQT67864.1 putative lipoprotein, rSAM/lipoprotein system [Anaerohalosphaera lusitana]